MKIVGWVLMGIGGIIISPEYGAATSFGEFSLMFFKFFLGIFLVLFGSRLVDGSKGENHER